MGKPKPKARRVCKRYPNFPAAPVNATVRDQHMASTQICVSSIIAASAMTRGLSADRRYPVRMDGWIHNGSSSSLQGGTVGF